MKRTISYIVFTFLVSVNLLGQYGFTITKQSVLNTLLYEDKVGGYLHITTEPGQDSSTMVVDLSPLQNLDTISGDLIIENTALTNLDGFRDIKFITAARIVDNALLEDVSGLNKPAVIGGIYIINNPKLKSITGYDSLVKVRSLDIMNNPFLEVIDINVNLPSYARFSVKENPRLQTVKVLDNNRKINGYYISGNANLETIEVPVVSDTIPVLIIGTMGSISTHQSRLKTIRGFEGLKRISIFRVLDNDSLSDLCAFKKCFKDYGLPMIVNLGGNMTGANSIQEILDSDCSYLYTGIGEMMEDSELLSIYPNPALDEVTVEGYRSGEEYRLYDMSGRMVQRGIPEAGGRIGIIRLQPGFYILEYGGQRMKMIKE